MKISILIAAFFLVSLPALGERVVFNDPYPDTLALEIWQLTDDPSTKYHSMYHNMTPFSHDGRYCFYVIVRRGSPQSDLRHGRTLGVYDLYEDREICRDLTRAYTPIWGNTSNAMYFVDDPRKEDAILYRLEVPSLKMVPLHTGPKEYCPAISFDDKYLFSAEDGKLYRYENREQGEKKLIYTPPHWPDVQVSIPKASPTRPWVMCRQNSNKPEVPPGTPARIIVDVNGRFVNTALMQNEHSHADWHASGDAILRGDGPLRIRRVLDTMPSDFLPLAAIGGGDPARQGASGRWGSINRFANGALNVSDLRSGRSWPVVRVVSHIHQSALDTRDLSGPYDCDQHGSPDGTKMYFSTNYDIRNFPVALITEPAGRDETEAITVDSTEGFPSSGVLSYVEEVMRYESKTPTQFRGLTRGYFGTKKRNPIAGWPIANYYGRADIADTEPLEHQHKTDAFIAVVRLPDPPIIVKNDDAFSLFPGRNHRETRAFVLYRDGKKERELPATAETQGLTLGNGEWTATAVEWSGLASKHSKTAINGPATLTIHSRRSKQLDAPQTRRAAPQKSGIQPAPGADSITIKSDEDGDFLWEFTKQGKVVEKRWATPGYPVTLIEKYEDGVRTERRILDDRGVNDELICTYDRHTGRLVAQRQCSWGGHDWNTFTFDNGMIESRVKTSPGRYEIHYRFNNKTWSLEQTAIYNWRGGAKVLVWPK